MTAERLWAPWRIGYLSKARSGKPSGCLFCAKGRSRADARNQVLSRGRLAFSMLNRFPYNNGHLLIAPYRHVGDPEGMTAEEWLDLFELVNRNIRRIRRTLKPEGFNIGINVGRAAGAGIPEHLHLHLVPRWNGDTNFMPTLAGAKVISQSLDSAWRLLRDPAKG